MNLREATVEILRCLRKADEEAASVGPESQAQFDRKIAAQEVAHSDQRQTQLENQKEAKEQEIQAIESAYRQRRAGLEQAFRKKHESLKEEATQSLQAAQKQKAALLEAKKEQIWLAETVFESSEDKPHEKFALTASTIRNQCRALKKQEEELGGKIRRIWASGSPPKKTNCPESLETFVQQFQDVVRAAESSKALRLLSGGAPAISLMIFTAIGAGTGLIAGSLEASAAAGFGLGIVMIAAAWSSKNKKAQQLQHLAATSRQHLETMEERGLDAAAQLRDEEVQILLTTRDQEIKDASEKYDPRVTKLEGQLSESQAGYKKQRDSDQKDYADALQECQAHREQELESLNDRLGLEHLKQRADLHQKQEQEAHEVQKRRQKVLETVQNSCQSHAATIAKLEHQLREATTQNPDPLTSALDSMTHRASPGASPATLTLDLTTLPGVRSGSDLTNQFGDSLTIPLALEFPDAASVLIRTEDSGREWAQRFIRRSMMRILTSLPPGKARFTIVDPVGLGQSLSSFMHLADADERLVSSRIWTDQRHIEQALVDLTEHLENVIQKYLRNDYETIAQYNEEAGEIAEPYRFLILQDFPTNLSEIAAKRLASLLTSGPRCGIFTLIHQDRRHALPRGFDEAVLERGTWILEQRDDQFRPAEPELSDFKVELQAEICDDQATRVIQAVGAAAIDASRVEVPFTAVQPEANQLWSRSCSEELVIPLGRSGAKNLQELRLGRGTNQHALIAGRTGSGKSTLLHVLVTNAALWYPPEELSLYLVDFKKGVEFKTYASRDLPHAKAVAVESDREFGLSVLERIDEELVERGEIFRRLGVQNLPGYRSLSDQPAMPRILLVIDEFQELFVEDDKLAQDASLLLDRIVRQGRAFGVHAIMGSQTLGGAYALARSTMGQMQIRVALQCSESDSYLILGEENGAARLLGRPGEAIYNDAGGDVAANSPFQIVWLGDEERDTTLAKIRQHAGPHFSRPEPLVVFEGSAPVRIEDAGSLLNATPDLGPQIWLGEPVAIRGPVGLPLKRQGGANLLLVGQQPEPATGLIAATIESLAHTLPQSTSDRVVLVDGTPVEDALAGRLASLADEHPGMAVKSWREADDAVATFHRELKDRLANGQENAPTRVLILHGLQRFRGLRTVEDFSFSASEGPPAPDKQFEELLRDGPTVGLHVVTWCDSVTNLNRTIARGTLRDFELKVLLQMSAADSSLLVDSPAAAQLGGDRALLSIEETNQLEKFRPYRLRGS